MLGDVDQRTHLAAVRTISKKHTEALSAGGEPTQPLQKTAGSSLDVKDI